MRIFFLFKKQGVVYFKMVYNIARSIIINLSLIKKLFMTQEEMTVLAKKVKEGVATKEEVFVFFKEFDRLLSEIKSVLEE